MSNKIIELPPHEAQKIAAGEVIERPANALKELIENSIDAQATAISIYIEYGGHAQIKVIDNGYGMSAEDALKAFSHHATSKIKSVDDLGHIHTFGFRGEALTSIDAVSETTIETREQAALHGTRVHKKGGEIITVTDAACPIGTTITVNNIFFNVPVRKKFLKPPETELRAINQLFFALCASQPSIHFQLFHNQKQLYNCPPADSLKNRVAQLWQHSTTSRMMSLTGYIKNGVSVTGIISDYHVHKYDKNSIYIFVNGRWIKNHSLAKALIKGYAGGLPGDKFPAAIIMLTIDPQVVDINVHPRKQEVQFLHPRIVESAIMQAVQETLQKQVQQAVVGTDIPSAPTHFNTAHMYRPPIYTYNPPSTIYTPKSAKLSMIIRCTMGYIVSPCNYHIHLLQ